MHYGPGPGGEWWQAALMMVLFWGGVAALIAFAVRAWARPPDARPVVAGASPSSPTAMEVLEDRLARGEMSVEEFAARRDALLGRGPEPAPTSEVTPEG